MATDFERGKDNYLNMLHTKHSIDFPEVTFEESDPELDHAGDIDYIAKVFSTQMTLI